MEIWKYNKTIWPFAQYLVQLDDGYIIQRHINQLRKIEVKKVVRFDIPDVHVPSYQESSTSSSSIIEVPATSTTEGTIQILTIKSVE